MRPVLAVTAVALAGAILSTTPTEARKRHHKHAAPAPSAYGPRPYVEAREPFSFYPENIDGGVRGNLPFNNQIRKFKDPLNAFGAGG